MNHDFETIFIFGESRIGNKGLRYLKCTKCGTEYFPFEKLYKSCEQIIMEKALL